MAKVTIISASIQEFEGVRYYLCGRYFQKRGARLHRVVWTHHHGPIPKGYHVHHMTGDTSKNQVEELELVRGARHLSGHMSSPQRVAESRRRLAKAQAAATAWHGSEGGRAWHREHYEQSLREKLSATIPKTCEHCGTNYAAPLPTATASRFCSNNCKSAARRASGVDVETRACAICGSPFTTNRYWTTRTCSRACAARLRASRA